MRDLTNLTVFTGSAEGAAEIYRLGAEDLGRELASRRVGVVYGGGRVGLMGRLADAALSAEGRVHGVIPESLMSREIGHAGLTELEVVSSMHERKQRMAELGDAFVALPGGAGTLEEFFEAFTWLQIGLHAKPVALYDVGGFWQPLLQTLRHMVEQGFMAQYLLDALVVASTPGQLLSELAAWEPPAAKWSRSAPSGPSADEPSADEQREDQREDQQ